MSFHVTDLARLSAADRQAFVESLTPEEAEALLHHWPFYARPEQLIPPPRSEIAADDWITWLILAGRGFGKTRVAAETVRQWIGQGFNYVNIIGATVDDVRIIMVDGESGIMAVCPRDERPRHNASKRRLEWPNGAISLLFSAEEPDRLRGKQHSKLACLAGDTPVTMADGSQKPIANVREGEFVRTRCGARRVLASALTRRNAEVYSIEVSDGRVLVATDDHPIFVEGAGFTPVADLKVGMRLCATPASAGAARSGTATTAVTTPRWFGFIGRFGKRQMGQFLKASTFIISTATKEIIGSITWNSCRTASTAGFTSTTNSGRTAIGRWQRHTPSGSRTSRFICNGFTSASNAARNIEAAIAARVGIAARLACSAPAMVSSRARLENANGAARLTKHRSALNATADEGAMLALASSAYAKARQFVHSLASIAAPGSKASAATRGSAHTPALSASMPSIVSVTRLPERRDVYDLAVEGQPEFFANGILVHNCDELAAWRYEDAWHQAKFGLRLGNRPQIIVSTTPRPTKIIREIVADPRTHITRGKTSDNFANLPDTFIRAITRKYEGTRLGRQELDAEILEDVPGALWTREMFDRDGFRLRKPPCDLLRVVVAVDPSGTKGKDEGGLDRDAGDEIGIVVAGLGVDQHGYVLYDGTVKDSPENWARQAIRLFHRFEADHIVAEVNYGGDLVRAVIQSVDNKVPFKTVHATRGKVVRAEPVSTLYEQSRVFHIGAFAKLEDQLCGFTPAGYQLGGSPDRADALVWAITELMLETPPSMMDVL